MYRNTPSKVIDQGAVLDRAYFFAIDEERAALVLTPTCDFEHSKAELVQLCCLFSAWEILRALLGSDWANMGLTDAKGELIHGPISATRTKEISDKMRQLIGQRIPRYHWLAPLPGTGVPLLADFQVLASLSVDELAGSNVVATLESPFREQAATRYASYMGRVGTPDFTKEQVALWIQTGINELFPPDDPAN